jgi:hypothetical protein
MDKIKSLGNKAIKLTKNWYATNWQDGMYGKGKTIFISVVAFFVIVKLIYDIFV